MPGLNDWAFEIVSRREKLKPIQNGMDGTRIIRAIELYRDRHLVGREFPPDVRLFSSQLVEVGSINEVQQYVLKVREEGAMLQKPILTIYRIHLESSRWIYT